MGNINRLEKFNECFRKIAAVVNSKPKSEPSHYLRIYDKVKKAKGENAKEKKEPAFSMTCFAPSFLFKMILEGNPISILITSGTLSPMDALNSDLGIPFD